MPIPSILAHRLREALAQHSALADDRALSAVFVDERLAPWRNLAPESTPNRAARINALISTLCDQENTQGENAFVLFLHVLTDNTDPADALHAGLTTLTAELKNYHPATLTDLKPTVQPSARLLPFVIILGIIAVLFIAIIALANLPAARDVLQSVGISQPIVLILLGLIILILWIVFRARRTTRSMTNYTHAIEIDPFNAEVYYNRGNAYYARGNYKRALADYTQAIELNPDYGQGKVYYARSRTYQALGRGKEARADIERQLDVLSVVPGDFLDP